MLKWRFLVLRPFVSLFGIDDFLLGTVGGSLVSGLFASDATEDTNTANAAQASINRDFQERMSSTSYQRSVKDLEAAGLNPMLAARVGGASTPGGATATMENPAGPVLNAVQGSFSNARQAMDLKTAAANQEQILATTQKIKSETMDSRLNTAIRAEELARVRWENANKGEENLLLSEGIVKARRENNFGMDTFSSAVAAAKADSLMKQFDSLSREDTFESDVRARKARNSIDMLGVPGAEQEAKFQTDAGFASRIGRFIQQILGTANSARRLR